MPRPPRKPPLSPPRPPRNMPPGPPRSMRPPLPPRMPPGPPRPRSPPAVREGPVSGRPDGRHSSVPGLSCSGRLGGHGQGGRSAGPGSAHCHHGPGSQRGRPDLYVPGGGKGGGRKPSGFGALHWLHSVLQAKFWLPHPLRKIHNSVTGGTTAAEPQRHPAAPRESLATESGFSTTASGRDAARDGV